MFSIRPLTASFAVAGPPAAGDIAGLAADGVGTIINFQLDAEPADAGAHAGVRRAAEALGLTYIHIPAAKHELFTDAVVERAAAALKTAAGTVVAHCGSGQRAAIIWAAATARSEPVDKVLGLLRDAGFELDFLRDDLEAQADRARWNIAAGHSPASAHAAKELEAA